MMMTQDSAKGTKVKKYLELRERKQKTCVQMIIDLNIRSAENRTYFKTGTFFVVLNKTPY
jgi:hypothetical protein